MPFDFVDTFRPIPQIALIATAEVGRADWDILRPAVARLLGDPDLAAGYLKELVARNFELYQWRQTLPAPPSFDALTIDLALAPSVSHQSWLPHATNATLTRNGQPVGELLVITDLMESCWPVCPTLRPPDIKQLGRSAIVCGVLDGKSFQSAMLGFWLPDNQFPLPEVALAIQHLAAIDATREREFRRVKKKYLTYTRIGLHFGQKAGAMAATMTKLGVRDKCGVPAPELAEFALDATHSLSEQEGKRWFLWDPAILPILEKRFHVGRSTQALRPEEAFEALQTLVLNAELAAASPAFADTWASQHRTGTYTRAFGRLLLGLRKHRSRIVREQAEALYALICRALGDSAAEVFGRVKAPMTVREAEAFLEEAAQVANLPRNRNLACSAGLLEFCLDLGSEGCSALFVHDDERRELLEMAADAASILRWWWFDLFPKKDQMLIKRLVDCFAALRVISKRDLKSNPQRPIADWLHLYSTVLGALWHPKEQILPGTLTLEPGLEAKLRQAGWDDPTGEMRKCWKVS